MKKFIYVIVLLLFSTCTFGDSDNLESKAVFAWNNYVLASTQWASAHKQYHTSPQDYRMYHAMLQAQKRSNDAWRELGYK